tara:strand:- start:1002 stop:2171 length:1170 start_codon:yes stop_codon:yes gene_type:complete
MFHTVRLTDGQKRKVGVEMNDWKKHWVNMPKYNNIKRPEPEVTAKFNFKTQEDYDEFHKLIKKHIYDGKKVFDGMQKKDAKTTWFPLEEKSSSYIYTHKKRINPRFPIYIVSKGRSHRLPTIRALDEMQVDYKVIIEQEDYEDYAQVVDPKKLLILPVKYKKDYDCFWDDGCDTTGPGAARNYAWDHSITEGYDWHWVMDDNIESFERLNNNKKIKCDSGNIFFSAEDFVLRYKNIGQAGFQYAFFCPASDSRPAYKLNTRIYSCLLIKNSLSLRWRGRYNEDTDLSLRVLKMGLCTVQFNAFLQGKRATQTIQGGNTEVFYKNEGTLNKSKMLQDMHPDVCKVVWRYNRWHHDCNYNVYKQQLIPIDKFTDQSQSNEFDMVLKRKDGK